MNTNSGRIEGIDIEIQIAFKSEYLKLLLPHLEKVGISNSVIDKMISDHIESGEKETFEWWILDYGQKILNPIVNKKLSRSQGHPTFNNMLHYVLKNEIENNTTVAQLRKYKNKLKSSIGV